MNLWSILQLIIRMNSKGCEGVGTIRQDIIVLLGEEELNAIGISQRFSIREKDVYDHLMHINKSAKSQGKVLRVTPYKCLTCGYVFKGRTQLKRPGRCPSCKECHIRMATYFIEKV